MTDPLDDDYVRPFHHDLVAFDVPADWIDDSVVRLSAPPDTKHPPSLVLSRDKLPHGKTLEDYADRGLTKLSQLRGQLGEQFEVEVGVQGHLGIACQGLPADWLSAGIARGSTKS